MTQIVSHKSSWENNKPICETEQIHKVLTQNCTQWKDMSFDLMFLSFSGRAQMTNAKGQFNLEGQILNFSFEPKNQRKYFWISSLKVVESRKYKINSIYDK